MHDDEAQLLSARPVIVNDDFHVGRLRNGECGGAQLKPLPHVKPGQALKAVGINIIL